MRHLVLPLTIVLIAILTGCSSMGTQAPPPNTNLAHDSGTPLFPADSAQISDTEIARILDTRIDLPPMFRVGVVHLDHERVRDGRRQFSAGDEERPMVGIAFAQLRDHERVYDVSYLPSLILPAQLTAGSLRGAAARFQADWLLIFKTGTSIQTKTPFLGTDQAKAHCSAECLVLDVRTGLIAFSSRSQVALARAESDEEWSIDETVGQVEQEAVEEAMTENVTQLVGFLDHWPG